MSDRDTENTPELRKDFLGLEIDAKEFALSCTESANFLKSHRIKSFFASKLGYLPDWVHSSGIGIPSSRMIIPTANFFDPGGRKRLLAVATDPSESEQCIRDGNSGYLIYDPRRVVLWYADPVFIVEQEFDAMAICQVDEKAIALCDLENAQEFFAYLDAVGETRKEKGKAEPICYIIAMGNDQAGNDAAEKLKAGFAARHLNCFRCHPESGSLYEAYCKNPLHFQAWTKMQAGVAKSLVSYPSADFQNKFEIREKEGRTVMNQREIKNAKRLIYALERRAEDSNIMAVFAHYLNYDQKQLAKDVAALVQYADEMDGDEEK